MSEFFGVQMLSQLLYNTQLLYNGLSSSKEVCKLVFKDDFSLATFDMFRLVIEFLLKVGP